MKLVFDLEANGLFDATKIWCIVTKDIETGEVNEFGPTAIKKGIEFLQGADLLVGHNIIDYDLPTIHRIAGYNLYDYVPDVFDTLVTSRLFWPDRSVPKEFTGKGGPHSLEAWGYRFGRWKPEYEDWSKFTKEMLHRCKEDVEINTLLYQHFRGEMEQGTWDRSLQIEHRVAEIITRQRISGVYLDKDAAEKLIKRIQKRIQEIDDQLDSIVPVSWKSFGVEIDKPFKKDGNYKKAVEEWMGGSASNISGPFTRVTYEKLNLNSDKQVKELLFSLGWQPISWNFKPTGERSSPKLEFADDGSDGLTGELARCIKERKLLSHRKSQVEGWLKNRRDDGRIPAKANPCGTNTGRFRHSIVVNVPKAAPHVPLGHEMRECFTSGPRRVLVGYDAEQIEIRILAHYMNDQEYIDAILSGDIHSYNQQLAGLPTRDDAKTFIYAFNYGAGDEKLGSIVGGTASDGRELRLEFLRSCPSLDKLISSVKRASGRGYLRGLDGRRLWMRRYDDGRIQRNKALNTLIQAGGAVVMKQSMILLDDWVRSEKLDAFKVLDMHDEAQWDVAPRHVERFKELAGQCIPEAGKSFDLNIPLAAEVKTGKNWAATH